MSSLRLLVVLLAVLAGSTLALPTGYGSYEAPAPTLGLEQPAQPVSIEPSTAGYSMIPTESLDEPTTASYGSVTEQQQLFDVPSTTAASGYQSIELDQPIVTDAYAPATTQAFDEPTTTIAASYGPSSTLALDVPTTTAAPVYAQFEEPSTTAAYQTASTIALDEPSTAGYAQTTAGYQTVPTLAQDQPITTAAYGSATTIALDEPTITAAPSYTQSYTEKALDVPTTTAAPAYEQPIVTESYVPVPTQALDETTTVSYGPASTIALDIPTTTAGYAVKSGYEAPFTTTEAPVIAPLAQDIVVKSDYSSYQPVPTIAQDVPTTTTAAPMTTASYGYTAQPTTSKTGGYVLNHDAARAYWATAAFPSTTTTASLATASLPTVAPAAQDSVAKASPYQSALKSSY